MAALKLPRTGYAVAIDLGDVHSPVTPIHPRRKQEVGRRLALSALSVQYGKAGIVHTGPVFSSIAVASAPTNGHESAPSVAAASGGTPSAAGATATVSFVAGTYGA